MSMSDMEFRAVLLDQMKDYLDGRITKEEYYDQSRTLFIRNTQILMKIRCFTSALWIQYQKPVYFILMSLV